MVQLDGLKHMRWVYESTKTTTEMLLVTAAGMTRARDTN
jgi:hypothetical protein